MIPKQVRPLAAVLVAATVLGYLPILGNDFVRWDDHVYLLDNRHVTAGLSWAGVRWAFTTFAESNWHPLTWLSHMLDCQLFGLWAPGHHLMNLLLHVVNALLVWIAFGRLTGDWSRSFALALLWAIHPTRVESVAWASERKDVLSSLFGLSALIAYERYARAPSLRRYGPVLLLFVLSLLAKPMWVTLPCALGLLDVWPLRRPDIRRAVLEKLPLVLLCVGSSWMTLQAQTAAMSAIVHIGLLARIQTALCGYAFYLWKTLVPVQLSFLYVHPLRWAAWQVGLSAVVLAAITALAARAARRGPGPALLIGWLWYLGTLVPVLGLVQVGMQFAADRYTYLPALGLLLMLVYAVPTEALQRASLAPAGRLLAAAVVLVLVGLTAARARVWRDTDTLYLDALAVAPDNAMVHKLLGQRRLWLHDTDGAVRHLTEAVRLRPRFSAGHAALGMALWRKGDLPGALQHITQALLLEPGLKDAPEALGTILQESKLPNPARAVHIHAIGSALDRAGRPAQALPFYLEALRLDPDQAAAHNDLGVVLAERGQAAQAAEHFQAALRARPGWAEPTENLKILQRQAGGTPGGPAPGPR